MTDELIKRAARICNKTGFGANMNLVPTDQDLIDQAVNIYKKSAWLNSDGDINFAFKQDTKLTKTRKKLGFYMPFIFLNKHERLIRNARISIQHMNFEDNKILGIKRWKQYQHKLKMFILKDR